MNERPNGIESIITDAMAAHGEWPVSQPGELTAETVREAIQAVKEAVETYGPMPASWHGRKEMMHKLLFDMGAAKADDGLTPLPVAMGALRIDLIHDEDVAPRMVIECAADGTILRGFACADDGQWYCIAAEFVAKPLAWYERDRAREAQRDAHEIGRQMREDQ